jgi:hypothetical protein
MPNALRFEAAAPPQLGIASEGGSRAPVPDFSIEIEDVDRIWQRAFDAELDLFSTFPEENRAKRQRADDHRR